ncbi:MAG: TSUP family transporter [Caulobacteraceae bacterium]
MLIVLFLAAVWAGAQNALAGGGSFVTLPAMMLTGLDARAANIASTIALFPGQVTTGWVNRQLVEGAAGLGFWVLAGISLAGGVLGAGLLLVTPPVFFAHIVPWLVLFATGVFAYGRLARRRNSERRRLGPVTAGAAQFLIAIYGGYFGGGIGMLMLAALTAAGLAVRAAGSTKNVLAGIMNAGAVALFAILTPAIPWGRVAIVAAGAMAGGFAGAQMLRKIDERILSIMVIVLGIALTVGLFITAKR